METKKVVRSLSICESDAIYDEMHIHGFEFTHHDIIVSQKERESMQRKISRLQALKGKKNFVFFYHHRANVRSDIERIFEKAQRFCQYYSLHGKTCHMVIFSQKIIHDHSERKLEYKKIDHNMHYFDFFVQHYWKWNSDDNTISVEKNQRDFFAIDDDDLMGKMIKTVRDILLEDKKIQDGRV